MAIRVDHFDSDSPGWAAYVRHLERVDMRHAIRDDGQSNPKTVYLGVRADENIIGHIALYRQVLQVQPSYLSDNQFLPLNKPDGTPRYEMFVESFAVETQYRRKGYGRALQQAAIQATRDAGCYQMRSWSSADRRANYALKLQLGFSVHPALYPTPGGKPVGGVYFIKYTAD